MIKSIELKNWKTHRSTSLSFSKGTNILIGQMGAGKSSIMDAISFALFGTFPAVHHKRVNVGKLIRNKPEQERRGHVKLEFTVDDDNYVVTRELNLNGPSGARLEKNGSYMQSQPERVNEEIGKALKIDYDLFSKAVYSEQNGLDYFLNLRSGERKKQIDGLLGLDKFALAQENATSLINRLRYMVDEAQKAAEGFDLDKARQQLNELEKEQEKLNAEGKETESSFKKMESQEKSIQERLSSLKKEYSKKMQLGKEIAEHMSKSKTLQVEIEKIEKRKLGSKDSTKKALDELNTRFKKLSEEEKLGSELERKLNIRIARLQAELERLESDAAEKSKLRDELKSGDMKAVEQKINRCTEEAELLAREIAAHESGKEEGEKWIKELEKHISKCPVCERELSKEMVAILIKGKSESIKKSTSELKRLGEQSSRLKLELIKLNKELNKLSVIVDKVKGFEETGSKLELAKDELKKAHGESAAAKAETERINESMSKARELMESAKASLEAITRLEEHALEKEKNDRLVSELQKEHDDIKADEKEIDDVQREFTKISAEIGRQKANLEAIVRYLKDKAVQVKEKSEEIERINKMFNDIKRKREIAENLVKFRGSLEETQAIMRTRLVDSINGIMGGIWPELYPYGDYTGIALEARDDDYILKVKALVNNELSWEDVESIASGGERSTACLAMRIAFALVLVPNLKWLILDEPTHNIDQQGLEKFIQVFNEMLPRIVDQVFIITHDDVLKQVQSARIYVFSRNKEENKPTEIISI